MGFFSNFFSPKRQRIIESVRNYYSGKNEKIPYSSKEIREAIEWVRTSDIENKEMLIEKLTMAELLVQAKEPSKSR
ncbi:hypothetical protein JMN32_21875 [Fulvivirga sp. 29W222]|uniref:Uncharacterized protein n=1 Tax=Fulvivirga marina TaxID=2494733 RepID=A0A937FZF8_9BACT|nr:hypothetical protein [Fulvivirga marina]MBL6448975.1 hypothetical protein [Fulvivirga marina]